MNVPSKFWMVLRLSKTSDEIQPVDSIPHRKHQTFEAAHTEAARLAKQHPNARGFVVLEAAMFIRNTPIIHNVILSHPVLTHHV